MSNEESADLREQFRELVVACENCAREAVRPWKILSGFLAAVLAVSIAWRQGT